MITIDEFVERLCRIGADRGPRRFPRKRRDRQIMMKSIRMQLDADRDYREGEINDLLKTWNRDVAPEIDTDHVTMRRLLVDYGHLERTADGRFYRVGFPPGPVVFDLDIDGLDLPATVTAYRNRARPPTPHADLNEVLDELVSGLREVLAGDLVGVYLVGSLALGDFDRHSDVDFVAVTRSDVSDRVLPDLQALHRRIHALPPSWARHLDGSYVPASIVKHGDAKRRELLYLDNGSDTLVRSSHCNRVVVRWMLRQKGIALIGPDPMSLVAPIDPDDMRDEARAEMRAWADEMRASPGDVDNRWDQPYAVLGYCRMLYTLEHATVASKPTAAGWALEQLDETWHPLIEQALRDRPDPMARSRVPADPVALEQTFAFVDHALERAEADRTTRPDDRVAR